MDDLDNELDRSIDDHIDDAESLPFRYLNCIDHAQRSVIIKPLKPEGLADMKGLKMFCENCTKGQHYVEMTRKLENTVKGEGYSRLIRYTCPECDFTFLKVA